MLRFAVPGLFTVIVILPKMTLVAPGTTVWLGFAPSRSIVFIHTEFEGNVEFLERETLTQLGSETPVIFAIPGSETLNVILKPASPLGTESITTWTCWEEPGLRFTVLGTNEIFSADAHDIPNPKMIPRRIKILRNFFMFPSP
jgi:hypothetical protein